MQYTFHFLEIQKDNGTKFELFTAQLSTGSVLKPLPKFGTAADPF